MDHFQRLFSVDWNAGKNGKDQLSFERTSQTTTTCCLIVFHEYKFDGLLNENIFDKFRVAQVNHDQLNQESSLILRSGSLNLFVQL